MAYTTINKSTDYFNTKLYTGDGTSPRSITGVGFQPDFLWIKNRTGATGYEHRLMDAVRGSNKVLHSSTTGAESSEEYYTVGSFDSDGWTGRNGTGSNQVITGGNDSGYTFASWNWKANGAGSANTDGTAANVTVSANQTAGFSIVQFDATQSRVSVGHGLGSTPDAIFMKETEGAGGWVVGGFGLDWNGYFSLQATSAFNNNSNNTTGTGRMFNPDGYAPTSSVWSTNGSAFLSGGTKTCIAYCFKSIPGYSKFGSYVANGSSTNATFTYTGFAPKFVMIKRITSADHWVMNDSTRSTNENNNTLKANSSDVEYTSTAYGIDLLSNGFKPYTSDGNYNANGDTYIYMAIGQSLVGSNGVTAKAR